MTQPRSDDPYASFEPASSYQQRPPGMYRQAPQQPPRRRGPSLGKVLPWVILAVVLVAFGAFLVFRPAAKAPAAAGSTAPASSAPAAATCKQQSDAWKASHASMLAGFQAALKPFAGGGTVTPAQARALAAASHIAEDAPPPSCADPAGWWGKSMQQLDAAGIAAEGGGISEVGSLQPMLQAETDISELDAELQSTIGESKL